MKWTEERNIHIVAVLHQNPSNPKARGHLGTELVNKAETVLAVFKENNIFCVETTESRNKPAESFAFEIIDDLPVLIKSFEFKKSTKQSKPSTQILDDLKVQQLIAAIFEDEKSYKYTKLRLRIQSIHNELFNKDIGDNNAKKLITYCKSKDWILQEKEKDPYTLGDFNDKSLV